MTVALGLGMVGRDRLAQSLALFRQAEGQHGGVAAGHRRAGGGGEIVGHLDAGAGGLGDVDMAVDPAGHGD